MQTPTVRRRHALQAVDFEAVAGDVVGIVGENGAGKTSLLRVIAKLVEPDAGDLDVKGRVSTVFTLGAGYLPALSGRENIYLVGALYGLSREGIQAMEVDIIEFAELADSIDHPLRTYSSGMKARLGFSIVSRLDTEIIALDEALSAGDLRFRRKAGNLIERFAASHKILLVVSHSTSVIREYCSRAYCLEGGRVVARGAPDEVCSFYEGSA